MDFRSETSPTAKLFVVLGSLNAMLGVILGAFGAHALKGRLPALMLAVWHTAGQYHVLHALGLIGIGLLALHIPGKSLLKTAGWFMAAGIVLFCGSLYLLALTRVHWLGFITPFGGMAFIIAWLLTAVAAWKSL